MLPSASYKAEPMYEYEWMNETGFSDKKVYRKVLDLYKKGYITCDDRSKTKVYSLTPDQEMMFINTSEMD